MAFNLFPDIEISETEKTIINQALSHPAVKKYLTSLAQPLAAGLVHGLPENGESDAEYLRKVAVVKGRLEALNTLLDFQPALPANPTPES